jgi:hypothetical protein
MRFLQEILKRSIGANNFSENQGGRLMFEADILDPGKADFDYVLQDGEKRVYIQCFVGVVSSLSRAAVSSGPFYKGCSCKSSYKV